MRKKVVILGLDALEYNIATEQKNGLLKQLDYGRLQIPILEWQSEPSTPVVWASFITGKNPSEHSITRFDTWHCKWLHKLDHFAQAVGIPVNFRLRVGHLLGMVGFKKKPIDKLSYQDIGTIFEDIPNSLAISIPSYNEWSENSKIRRDMVLSKLSEERWQAAEAVLKTDYKRLEQFLPKINEVELIMVHISFLDIIQHLYFFNQEIIGAVYKLAEDILLTVLSRITPGTLVFIISDHGQHSGHHTPYGFYSSNAVLNLTQPSIEDFRELIKAFLHNRLDLSPKSGQEIMAKAGNSKSWDQEKLWRAFLSLIKLIKDYETDGPAIDKAVDEKQKILKKRLESLGYL